MRFKFYQRLANRKRKLLSKGYIIDYDDDYRRFALKFKRMKGFEQLGLIRELDGLESDDEDSGQDSMS